MNTYAYVGGNPQRYVDPLGLWSTEAHNYILTQFMNTFFPGAPSDFVDAVLEGSRRADSIANQGPGKAYMHAMTSSQLDKSESCFLANKYIAEELLSFNFYAQTFGSQSPYYQNAGWALGQALHPIMDSTSPSHAGWQMWEGILSDAWFHGGLSPLSMEGVDVLERNSGILDITLNKMKNAFDNSYFGKPAFNCGCE